MGIYQQDFNFKIKNDKLVCTITLNLFCDLY